MNSDYEQAGRDFQAAEESVQVAETVDEDLALEFLATLPPLEYDHIRKAEAKRLGVGVVALDRAVEERRRHFASVTGHGADHKCGLKNFTPADHPVNGEKMLAVLERTITRFIVLPPHGALAVGLWIVRTHAHDLFDINPRLALCSAEKRCGKTTLFELLAHLTPRVLLVSNVTPATVFRIIEVAKLTLLIDEVDSFKDAHEELRGILNSGHRRGAAFVLRCVGEEHEPKPFSTWSPMALAAIGQLPDTLEDRSIIIRMRRRASTEKVERLRWSGKHGEALRTSLNALARGIARWVSDHREALCEAEPLIPEGLNDRAIDNWFPLLAIAEAISGDCADRAREAAIAISNTNEWDNDSIRIQLLHDVRAVFVENGNTNIQSQRLCEQLAAMEERPWATWKRGHSITPAQLARMLRLFEIRSRDVWMPERGQNRCVKGYEREDFEDTFTRYLSTPSQPDVSKREDARTRSRSGEQMEFLPARTSSPASKRGPIPAPDAAPRVLADDNRGGPPNEDQLRQLTELWRHVKATHGQKVE